ncbi:MAG: hypothetical protein CL931_17385 [Deltaproteobacteria bacterium]|nr:hypothetical protein [Deltaproteobacteria bacterium]
MGDSRYGGGGGAGGSIWLTAGNLAAGSGNQVEAQGGAAGGSFSMYRGGGGGGGRILVDASAVAIEPEIALWSAEGGYGRAAGGAGSVLLQVESTTTVIGQ